MQPTNTEIKKAQSKIALSFTKKARMFVPRLQKSKTLKQAFGKFDQQLKKENLSLKKLEKSFIDIDKNIRSMRLYTMGLVDLSKPEEVAVKRAGRRRPVVQALKQTEKPEKRKKPSFLGFLFKVKKRPPTKLKTKPRPPKKRIKPSNFKKTTNKKLRNTLARLKARVKQRLAKLAGLRRYRANVEASRIQRRNERARFKQEARALRQRLVDEQNRRLRIAESESRRIRANADAEASKIRNNAQAEAQRRLSQADADANKVRADAETRARNILGAAEAESRQRIDAANRQVTRANERVQQVNEEVKRIETRRQQFINDAAEAQRVVREAQTELKRVQADTTLAANEKERLVQRQQQLIRENESIRTTFRDEAAKLDLEQQRIKAQIAESESRLNNLRNSAEEIRLSEQRRIQRLVAGGEVPTARVTPTETRVVPTEPRITPSEPRVVAPPRVVTEPLIRVVTPEAPPRTPTTPPARQSQVAALLRPPGQPKPEPIDTTKRVKQIAVLLSKPPTIKASLNIITPAQKVIALNAVQQVLVGSAKNTMVFIAKNVPGLSLLVGAGFTIKAAVVDKTKVGTILNGYATLTKSFTAALATIYPLTVNQTYYDIFGVYPEKDPYENWDTRLYDLHMTMYYEFKEAVEKLKKSWNNAFDELANKWRRDLNRGFLTTLGGVFDTTKPGPRKQREIERLQRSSLTPESVSVDEAIMKAAQMTGVDPKILKLFAMLESSDGKELTNKDSNALGLMQFTPGTWELMKKNYPQFENILNRGRMNFDASALAGALYIDFNSKILAKAGIPVNIETLYAAHFLGPGHSEAGAIGLYKLLETEPNEPAAKYFEREANSNPEIFYRKVRAQRTPRTIAEVVQKLRDRINKATNAIRSSTTSSNNVASDVMKTSEAIQNSQTNNQGTKNIVVVNKNTTLLSRRGINPYGTQESAYG
jgi:hypothetical protein